MAPNGRIKKADPKIKKTLIRLDVGEFGLKNISASRVDMYAYE